MPIYKGSTKIGTIYKGPTKIGKVYHGSTLVYEGNTKTIPIYQVPANLSAGGNTNYAPITVFGYPTANTTVPHGAGPTDNTPGKYLIKSVNGTLGTAGSSIVATNPMSPSNPDVSYTYDYSRTFGGYYFHLYTYTVGGFIPLPFRLYVSPKQRVGDYVVMDTLPSEFVCNANVTGGTSIGYYPPGETLAPYTYSVAFTGSPVKIFDYYYRKA